MLNSRRSLSSMCASCALKPFSAKKDAMISPLPSVKALANLQHTGKPQRTLNVPMKRSGMIHCSLSFNNIGNGKISSYTMTIQSSMTQAVRMRALGGRDDDDGQEDEDGHGQRQQAGAKDDGEVRELLPARHAARTGPVCVSIN